MQRKVLSWRFISADQQPITFKRCIDCCCSIKNFAYCYFGLMLFTFSFYKKVLLKSFENKYFETSFHCYLDTGAMGLQRQGFGDSFIETV